MNDKEFDELIYISEVLEDEATNMQLDASKLKMRLQVLKRKDREGIKGDGKMS